MGTAVAGERGEDGGVGGGGRAAEEGEGAKRGGEEVGEGVGGDEGVRGGEGGGDRAELEARRVEGGDCARGEEGGGTGGGGEEEARERERVEGDGAAVADGGRRDRARGVVFVHWVRDGAARGWRIYAQSHQKDGVYFHVNPTPMNEQLKRHET